MAEVAAARPVTCPLAGLGITNVTLLVRLAPLVRLAVVPKVTRPEALS